MDPKVSLQVQLQKIREHRPLYLYILTDSTHRARHLYKVGKHRGTEGTLRTLFGHLECEIILFELCPLAGSIKSYFGVHHQNKFQRDSEGYWVHMEEPALLRALRQAAKKF